MLLNKIPVLDKGFVALIDSSNTTKKLREIGKEFFNDATYPAALEKFGTLTLVIKCPLFVQLSLSKYSLSLISADQSRNIEAYKPAPHEILSKSREINEAISDDISRTTEALLINPKAYMADGADKFVSQIITPISAYTTVIAHGAYKDWCEYAYNSKLPSIISVYADAVKQIIESEWK
jgi:hypothetical protein